MEMKNTIVEIAEGLEWNVEIDGQKFTFSKYSPAGQDFSFCIELETKEDLINNIQEYIEGYDVSYETYIWLDDTGHGANGSPYDMKDVYEDMEACLENVRELFLAFEKVKNFYQWTLHEVDQYGDKITFFDDVKQAIEEGKKLVENVSEDIQVYVSYMNLDTFDLKKKYDITIDENLCDWGQIQKRLEVDLILNDYKIDTTLEIMITNIILFWEGDCEDKETTGDQTMSLIEYYNDVVKGCYSDYDYE
jgi:hypothetical protein